MAKPSRMETTHKLGRSDAELVRACAQSNTETAFTELLHRHGRTVFAVCRGILGNGSDADDAFQATFLVLMRRASSIRHPEAVGGWLCGVATHVAKRQRQRRNTKYAKEVAMMSDPSPLAVTTSIDPSDVALDADARAVLWAELGELPEKYRDALVLYHFEELTTEQAAERLNCPVGTLRGRLSKGRELLRSRLVRRGVTLTAAALIAILVTERAEAAPPPELLEKITSAATHGASSNVASLADSVVLAMSPRWKISTTVVGLIVVAVLALFLFWLLNRNPPADEVAFQAPAGPGTLLVVSQQDATVSLIDPATGRIRATIATDPCPHEVAVSPNGRLAAIANYGLPFGPEQGSTVTLLDLSAGKKLRTVNVGGGAAPHGLCWLSDDRLLCTVEQIEAVVEIDATLGSVIRTIRTAQAGTHMVAARAGGTQAFTANVLSTTISSLDLTNGVARSERRLGGMPESLALSPDGATLWVGNRADDTLAVLATDDLRVLKTVPAPGMLLRLAFAPDGKSVAVTAHQSNELILFDAVTLTETRRIKLSSETIAFNVPGPATVVFSPDSKTAYCTMHQARAVAVVDVVAGVVTGKFDVPGGALDGIAFSPITPNEDEP